MSNLEVKQEQKKVHLGEKVLVSLFISFLFLKSTAGVFWSEENRLFFHWRWTDGVAVALAIGVVACAFYGAYVGLQRLGQVGQWVGHVGFVAMALFYLKVNITEAIAHYLTIGSTANLAIKAVLGGALCFAFVKPSRVSLAIKNVCLLLSPILAVYLFTLFTAHGFQSNIAPAQSNTEAPPTTPGITKVYLLIFDEWSHLRTFDGDGVRPEFPHLQQVAQRSVVFQNALSPANDTFDSVPSLLCGVRGRTHVVQGKLQLRTQEQDLPTDEYPHFFKAAKEWGYRTAIYGHYFPYPELVRTGVDRCESRSIYKVMGTSIPGVASGYLLENIAIRSPFLQRVTGAPYAYCKHHYFADLAAWHHQAMLHEISSVRTPSFVFVHYPVPHAPFIFDKNGPRTNLWETADSDLPDYLGNLRYTDRLIGELLAAINSSPERDSTLLILTSDHTFRHDPTIAALPLDSEDRRHVPLLVHLPGQTTTAKISSRFGTANLLAALKRYQEAPAGAERFAQICQELNTKEQ